MEKIYRFKNAIVYIKPPTEKQLENIHKSTERFLTKLVKEGYMDGYSNKTGSINKK
jgi:hypothetical protein